MFGRQSEREALERLLTEARAGRSGAVLLRGEAGIGKSAVLQHAQSAANKLDFRVERAIGMESERQFAYAALHRLCSPLLGFDARLVQPQREALAIVFGTKTGNAPDRFLVSLAVLNLLSESAETQPLLCLVDDAQWLDRASAEVIAFVARRIAAERVVIVIASRGDEDAGPGAFSGIPVMTITGLRDADSRALLAAEVLTPIDDALRERVVAEAHGNPLALLELPRSVHTTILASGFDVPDHPNIARRLESGFVAQSKTLPTDSQRLLVLAAAEPTGDTALLFRAASHSGIERDAAAAAEAVGLLTIDSAVSFRHPLVRSALYGAATPSDRRHAHEALAAAIDPSLDPDRHAWHQGQAVLGPDETVAAELARAGDRALARGGMAGAAAFMQRAAELTPDPALRASRAMEAAQAKHEAGSPEEALRLLTLAERVPLDPLQSARLRLFRAQITFYLFHSDDVPGELLEAARALAPLNGAMSRETFLLALNASIIAGAGARGDVRDIAGAARSAPPSPTPPRPLDYLLDGLMTSYTEGFARGARELRQALASFRDNQLDQDAAGESDSDRWLWLASRTAVALFDEDLMHGLASRNVAIARRAGAVATLYAALVALSAAHVLSGEFGRAEQLIVESTAVARATGAAPLPYGEMFLAAWRGDEAETTELFEASARTAGPGNGAQISLAHYTLAVLHNASGNFTTAVTAALRAAQSDELAVSSLALPELIEATARAGRLDDARAAFEQLAQRALASGTSWALGIAARSEALITPRDGAERHYVDAIGHLTNARMTPYLGRAHLVYGEWLRRGGHRQRAREQLRVAHDMLADVGATAFAERAARELRATGEHPRPRAVAPGHFLTQQELHIARLVSTGATSREVAAMLFLSPRTIDAHLRNIFRKLGISSRRQLKELGLA